ncbi:hypothetical protein BC829DRAFT_160747 [Chytridium lagenaria]|nr:hypothetical protein BC829DRAFT_160747 [Chytridium lagenaria]
MEALERLTTTPIALEANGEERVRVKAIGVSNYEEKHILELLEYAVVKPAVNQVELHPLYGYKELRKVCCENGFRCRLIRRWRRKPRAERVFENTVSVTGNPTC